MTATILAHGGAPRDYLGEDRVPGPILPLICVPTTAGTGSEVSASGVFTDQDNHIKVGAMSNYLRPAVAVVDPRLTLSCPQESHRRQRHRRADARHRSLHGGRQRRLPAAARRNLAAIRAAIRWAIAWPKRRSRSSAPIWFEQSSSPNDLAAREAMSLGAMLAGLAFSNVGVALVHALEYPIGGATHCSHGAGNGMLLPYVMRYNLPARRTEFARVAAAAG